MMVMMDPDTLNDIGVAFVQPFVQLTFLRVTEHRRRLLQRGRVMALPFQFF